ncbi:MAG: N4-gp56 family major capsid protein [Candidatus Thorarchaeota archaeon]|jgi:N4-gp56 family major capsid protein
MPAPNVVTSATLSPDTASLYIQDKLLERAKQDLVFAQFGMQANVPTGEGRTTSFVRYERLPLPTTPLVEGETPAATAVRLSTVQAVLDQWGAYVTMTDVSQLTVKHPIFSTSRGLIEDQHNETVDREIQVPLLGSSAVTYAGAKTTRSALTAADVLTTTDIRTVVSLLRQNGARTFSGGKYRGVVDPYVEQDLNADATFVNASSYSNISTLHNAEIGTWMGVRWVRSNMIPIISAEAAGDVTQSLAAAASGETGFTNGTTVRTKTTGLDATTGFETVIDAEVANSPVTATPVVTVTIAAAAATGTYRIYSSLEDGAAGTPTFQVRVVHTTGTADTIRLIKSGTPSTSATFVVGATGAVAPPDASANGNVHISYIFGQNHFGVTKMSEGMKAFLTASGAEKSDPLDQRRTMGWKRMMKAIVLNPNFGRRIESLSAYN